MRLRLRSSEHPSIQYLCRCILLGEVSMKNLTTDYCSFGESQHNNCNGSVSRLGIIAPSSDLFSAHFKHQPVNDGAVLKLAR